MMFHLSISVDNYEDCLAFHGKVFDAQIVPLSSEAANVFVFGGQLTLHRAKFPNKSFATPDFHFGASLPIDQFLALRRKLRVLGAALLVDRQPDQAAGVRGKLQLLDPAGNRVELNGEFMPAASDVNHSENGR